MVFYEMSCFPCFSRKSAAEEDLSPVARVVKDNELTEKPGEFSVACHHHLVLFLRLLFDSNLEFSRLFVSFEFLG